MKNERYLISSTEPLIAFVVPVHNQVEIIASNLDSLIDSTILPFEIVIINDGSEDGTGHELHLWCERILRNPPQNACSIEILQTRRGRFETWCDKEGIHRTSAPHIIEVQADMNIVDKGFDARLHKLMKSNPDVIALSGRGVETFADASTNFKNDLVNTPYRGLDFGYSFFVRETIIVAHAVVGAFLRFTRRPKTINEPATLSSMEKISQVVESDFASEDTKVLPEENVFQASKRAGRLGDLMEKHIEISENEMNQIWLGESIMRGPLMIDRRKFIEIGGFNSDIFFLGHDDHDMARRAWITRGYRVGFHPVNFTSPLNHGSTRKHKSFAKKFVLSKKRARMARKSNESYLISHMDIERYQLPKSEVRALD